MSVTILPCQSVFDEILLVLKINFSPLSLNAEKKRYRESYISDELDLDHPCSEGSPRLSRHSTSSSGIEADTRQRSVSVEMVSMEEKEKSFISAVSHGFLHTSGMDTSCKAQTEEDKWQEEGESILIINISLNSSANFRVNI